MTDRNSNAHDAPRTDSAEQHQRYFKGTWASDILHDLVADGVISTDAAWLLMVIDSLSSTERGCFASNAYLASRLNRSERTAMRAMEELEAAHLLVAQWEGSQRFLSIDFSRQNQATRDDVYHHRKRGRVVRFDYSDPSNLTTRDKDSDSYESSSAKERGAGAPPLDAPRRPTSLSKPRSKLGSTPPLPVDLAAAKQLKEALRSNGRQVVGYYPATWANEFRLLRDHDKQNYQPILDAFCAHCSEAECRRLGLPDITTAKQFRRQFTWIKGKLVKDSPSIAEEVTYKAKPYKLYHRVKDGSKFGKTVNTEFVTAQFKVTKTPDGKGNYTTEIDYRHPQPQEGWLWDGNCGVYFVYVKG